MRAAEASEDGRNKDCRDEPSAAAMREVGIENHLRTQPEGGIVKAQPKSRAAAQVTQEQEQPTSGGSIVSGSTGSQQRTEVTAQPPDGTPPKEVATGAS